MGLVEAEGIGGGIKSIVNAVLDLFKSGDEILEREKKYEEIAKEKEEKEKARKEKMRNASKAVEPDVVTEKDQKKIDNLKKQTDEVERKRQLDAMSARERADALAAEIALLEKKSKEEKNPVKLAEAALEIAKRKTELQSTEKQADDEDKRLEKKDLDSVKREAWSPQVNSLQQMGGFLGSYSANPEVTMIETQKRSEGHLLAIKNSTEAMSKGMQSMKAGKSQSVKF